MWIVVITFILSCAAVDFWRKMKSDMKTNLRGSTPMPFFGHVLQYLFDTPESIVQKTIESHKKHGKVVRYFLFNKPIMCTYDVKDIEVLWTNPKYIPKNDETYGQLSCWLKTGLLLSEGEKWHARRKIITPALHFSILEDFIRVFDEQSNILVEKLRPHSENRDLFDIYRYIGLATLDAIAENALGIKMNAQTHTEHIYVKSLHGLCEILSYITFNRIYQSSIVLSTIGYKIKKKRTELLKTLHDFTTNIIMERRKILQEQINTTMEEKDDEDIGQKKRMAFLDVLLQANINGKPLSDEDIREEVDTFTFEGHDTTTSGICFTLYLLSRHPDAQEKVFDEIRRVFGDDKNKLVTYKTLQELKYTECVIKEALRMYPPVRLIGRRIDQDSIINDKLLPAGSSVVIPFFLLLNDEEYFPEPEKFIPERHNLEKSGEHQNSFAYSPFSAGPRNCIGQKFAMLEMKSIITKILRHYELLPFGEDIKPYITVVTRSRTGFQMGVKPRIYS